MNKWEKLREYVERWEQSATHNQRIAYAGVLQWMDRLDSEEQKPKTHPDGDDLEDRLKNPNSPINKLRASVSWCETDIKELMGARDALWKKIEKLERRFEEHKHTIRFPIGLADSKRHGLLDIRTSKPVDYNDKEQRDE